MTEESRPGKSSPPEGRQNQRLESWKEIAAYLKRDVRTVQRWEKSEGLPIHRHAHTKLATVYTSKSELDKWWTNRRSVLEESQSKMPAKAPSHRARPGWLWGVGLLAMLAIAALAGRLFWQAAEPPIESDNSRIRSLAVLPLANISGDAEQDYFADGMTDALIDELTKVSSLRVVSRNSVISYRGNDKPISEISRELDVDAIVEGSVLLVDDEVRITVGLVRAATDTNLWSDSYERGLKEVLTLQSEVARAIVREVRATLRPGEEARLEAASSVNPEAHLAYLRGKAHWNTWSVEGVEKSIEYFNRSIAADPSYAPAYSGLGRGLRFLTLLQEYPDKKQLLRAKEAEEKALDLDENLAEAHSGLAASFSFEWNWAKAEQHFLRSLKLKPGYAHGHHRYAILYLAPQGRLDDALVEIHRTLDLDPLSIPNHMMLGEFLYYKRDYDRAIEQLRETLALTPDSPQVFRFLGHAYREKGLYKKAIEMFGKAVSLTGSTRDTALLGHALAVSGQEAEARELLRRMLKPSGKRPTPPWALALLHIGLGERPQALECLERAYLDQEYWLSFMTVEPLYDSLRSEPRFAALVEKIGLGGSDSPRKSEF